MICMKCRISLGRRTYGSFNIPNKCCTAYSNEHFITRFLIKNAEGYVYCDCTSFYFQFILYRHFRFVADCQDEHSLIYTISFWLSIEALQ